MNMFQEPLIRNKKIKKPCGEYGYILNKNTPKKIHSILEPDLEKRNALYKDPELYGEEAPDSQATP